MKILVVASTPYELKAIKEWIKFANLKTKLNIDFLCSWIWNYETISCLEHYLTQNQEPTFIRNIWICEYRNPNNEKKSNPIQIANTINIYTEKELIVPPFLQIAPLKNCFCSENIVQKKPKFNNKFNINNEIYFDTESRWVEFIASKYKLPRLILKIPFDFIGKNEDIKTKDYKKISKEINEILKRLTYNKYLQKIIKRINQQDQQN